MHTPLRHTLPSRCRQDIVILVPSVHTFSIEKRALPRESTADWWHGHRMRPSSERTSARPQARTASLSVSRRYALSSAIGRDAGAGRAAVHSTCSLTRRSRKSTSASLKKSGSSFDRISMTDGVDVGESEGVSPNNRSRITEGMSPDAMFLRIPDADTMLIFTPFGRTRSTSSEALRAPPAISFEIFATT
eukprot:6712447-Prymnesium_polylepis.2